MDSSLRNEINQSFDTPESVSQVLHNFQWAIATKDWARGVNFYQRALNGVLYRKFDMKVHDRIKLIWLVWGVITDTEKPSIIILKKLVSLLSKLLRKHKPLKEAGLELPWRPLYDILATCCLTKWKTPDYNSTNTNSLGRALTTLIRRSRRFFSDISVREVTEHFAPKLCIHTIDAFEAQTLLDLFLKVDRDSQIWLPIVLGSWDWIPGSQEWYSTWISLLSRLAKKDCGTGAVHWDDTILNFVFSAMVRQTGLGVGSSSLTKIASTDTPNYLDSLYSTKASTLDAYAKFIVYTISPSSPTLNFLGQFISQIKTYFHPSNDGWWSPFLASFLHNLGYHYVKRIAAERNGDLIKSNNKLTTENHNTFLSILLPVSQRAVYGKSYWNSKIAVYSAAKFSHIDPDQVYTYFIDRISFIMSSETFARQISNALETSSSILPPTVKSLAFSKTLSQFLLLGTLPAIDINDASKTYAALKFYYGILSYIPIIGETGGYDKLPRSSSRDSEIDEENAQNRKEVVGLFSEWAPKFLERLCDFFYHKDKSTTRGHFAGVFNAISFQTIKLLFTQLSDKLFIELLDQFVKFIKSINAVEAKKDFGQLCMSAVLRDPSLALKKLISLSDLILPQKSDTFSGYSSENKIIWNAHLMASSFRYAGPHLLPYREKILSLISAAFSDPSKKKIVSLGFKIIRNVLKSLTNQYPTDFHSHIISQRKDPDFTTNHWKYWAPNIDKKHLEVQWHVPSGEEINFAKEIIAKYGEVSLSVLNEMSHPNNDKSSVNYHKMAMHLSTLRAIFVGAGPILPESETESDFSSELDAKNEVAGLVPLKSQKLAEKSVESFLGIRSEFLLKNFREKACDVVHSVSLRFLATEEHKDYVPVIRSLVKVLVTLATTREGIPQQFTKKKRRFDSVKELFKNELYSERKYPRAILVQKQHLVYLEQLDSFMFGLPLHKQAKNLLDDILALFCSHYEPLKAVKSSIVSCFRMIPMALSYCLPKIIKKLNTKESTESEILAVVDLLSTRHVSTYITKKWNLSATFFKAILHSNVHEKATLQTKIYDLFGSFVRNFYAEPIKLNSPASTSAISAEILEKSRETISYNNTLNERNYNNIVNGILECLENPQLHWRYQLMALASLLILLRKSHQENSVKILRTSLQIFEKTTLALVRTLAMQVVHSILLIHKNIFVKSTSRDVPYRSLDRLAQNPNTSVSATEWDTGYEFLDKLDAGWNGDTTISVKSPIPPSERNMSDVALEFQKILREKFLDKSFLEKILQKIGHDHNFKDDEEKDRDTRSLEGKLAGLARAVNMNVDAFVGQFGGSNENKTILTNLVGSRKRWPTTRIHAKHIGKGFSSLNAHFWKMILLWVGEPIFNVFPDILCRTATDEERGFQCAASEFFAGAVRVSKYMPYEHFVSLTNVLSQCFSRVRDFGYGKESLLDWSTAIKWAATDTDPRRLTWLSDVLFVNPLSNDKTSQAQVQHIQFLQCLLEEFSWRGISFSDKVLDYVANYLDHSYKQVRESIASLLLVIFSLAKQPLRDYNGKTNFFDGISELHPKHTAFVTNLAKKLSDNQSSEEVSMQHVRETVAQWVSFAMEDDMHALSPYMHLLLPHIFAMQKDNSENTRNLSKVAITLSSQLQFRPNQLPTFISQALVPVASHSSWRVKSTLSPFLQIFVFNHSFFLSPLLSSIFDIITTLIGDKQIEVADTAKKGLASLIRSTGEAMTQQLINRFTEMASVKLPKRNDKSKEAESALAKRHVGILGLSALVESQPYEVPNWLPEVVVIVAQAMDDPVPIKKTASDCVKEFWRTHQDEWIFFQEKFTHDQVSTIKQTTAPSYYA